jgi:hypothetical protein
MIFIKMEMILPLKFCSKLKGIPYPIINFFKK